MTFKPGDFELSSISEARQQLAYAIRFSPRELDPKTSFWVIKRSAWLELIRAMDIHMVIQCGPTRRKELMGLPVRATIDDEPDVPMIQLAMEPKVDRRKA